MASNPLFIIPDFFCIFQTNLAMATLGLKEMGKFLWEGRENGRERKGLRGKNNKMSCCCSFGELNPDLSGERQVS